MCWCHREIECERVRETQSIARLCASQSTICKSPRHCSVYGNFRWALHSFSMCSDDVFVAVRCTRNAFVCVRVCVLLAARFKRNRNDRAVVSESAHMCTSAKIHTANDQVTVCCVCAAWPRPCDGCKSASFGRRAQTMRNKL